MRKIATHTQSLVKKVSGLLYQSAGLILGSAAMALGAVTITSPTPAIQADFIAGTTAQWESIVKPGLFAGDFKVTLTGKKIIHDPLPQISLPCTLDESIVAIVAVTTQSYVYGFANGQSYERQIDLGTIGNAYTVCASTDTCTDGLYRVSNTIYQQNFSTPTVINLP